MVWDWEVLRDALQSMRGGDMETQMQFSEENNQAYEREVEECGKSTENLSAVI